MSASRVLPSWRPIHDCGQPTGSGPCPQSNAFDDPKCRCYYHFKLDTMPMSNGAQSRGCVGNHSPNPRNRYDYGAWFDGQVHVLTWNVDFAADVKAMRNMLYKAARRHGCDVTVCIDGATITVQAQRAEGAA